MVITGATGNRVTVKSRPRVQIPPAPPNTHRRLYNIAAVIFYCFSGVKGRAQQSQTAVKLNLFRTIAFYRNNCYNV